MELENFEDEQAHNDAVKAVVLPKWLTDEFPEHLPHLAISYDEGTFWVSDNVTAASFSNIVEAYDYARQFSEEAQVVFDSSVDGHGGTLFDGTFLCKSEPVEITGKTYGGSRLLSGMTTEDMENMLKDDYLTWLTEFSVEYNANPEDFVTAHRWLSHHPMFWIKGKKEKSFHWGTDNGLSNMAINVWADEETGKPVVFLEHGQHHEDGYTKYYHDPRIFVKAESYEKAVIAMAKKVNVVFDLDGYERKKTEETGA